MVPVLLDDEPMGIKDKSINFDEQYKIYKEIYINRNVYVQLRLQDKKSIN